MHSIHPSILMLANMKYEIILEFRSELPYKLESMGLFYLGVISSTSLRPFFISMGDYKI